MRRRKPEKRKIDHARGKAIDLKPSKPELYEALEKISAQQPNSDVAGRMLALTAFTAVFSQMSAAIDRWYPDLTEEHKQEAELMKRNMESFFGKMGL
jgi:hypothetical protein